MTQAFVPVSSLGRNGQTRTFGEVADGNPCDGCSAPCCRITLTPHPAPTTFTDLDYIRYLLAFPGSEVIVDRDGAWQQVTHRTCGFLASGNSRCTVHGTDRKPKVCVFFDPYRCWYKRNFTTQVPPDIVRIDAEGFERLLCTIELDEDQRISRAPDWHAMRDLLAQPAPTRPG